MIKIRLDDGIFLSVPFKVVTIESVGKPFPVKLICEIGLGSHVCVVPLNTNTWPSKGTVPEMFLSLNFAAFQIAEVFCALIVNTLSPLLLVMVIPVVVLSLRVSLPTNPFIWVTPPVAVAV